MSGVKIEVRDEKVLAGFARMKTAAQRARQFFQAMAKPVKADLKEHGDEQRGPHGAWPPRKALKAEFHQSRDAATGRFGQGKRRRSRVKGGRLLGKITRSFRQRATERSLISASPIPWAGIHDTGGRVGRGSILPARPFLWISREVHETASQGYSKWVVNAFQK